MISRNTAPPVLTKCRQRQPLSQPEKELVRKLVEEATNGGPGHHPKTVQLIEEGKLTITWPNGNPVVTQIIPVNRGGLGFPPEGFCLVDPGG